MDKSVKKPVDDREERINRLQAENERLRRVGLLLLGAVDAMCEAEEAEAAEAVARARARQAHARTGDPRAPRHVYAERLRPEHGELEPPLKQNLEEMP